MALLCNIATQICVMMMMMANERYFIDVFRPKLNTNWWRDNIYLLCILMCTQICIEILHRNSVGFDAILILIVILKILKPVGNN